MNKLREIIETKVKILTEKESKDGSMKILAPWIVTGRLNKNRRLYPLALIQREVAKFQDRVKKGSAIGSADHPAGVHTTLGDASHIITKLEIDSAGKGWMEATVLPTSKGKNVIKIIKAGGELGISARGAGTVNPSGTVESDYKLLGIDFCTSPAEPEAVFDKSNICESLEFEEDEDAQRQKDLEEEIVNIERESYIQALEAGFHGSQEDWEELHGGDLREMMGIKKEDGKTTVEKLTEEQVKKKTFSYFQEAKEAGFRGDYDAWKKAFPHIVERASEGIKLSEQKKKEPEKSFVGDVRFYYNEAVKAGYKDTIEKFKEKRPELVSEDYEEKIAEEAKRKKPETLTEEATRIFTELKKQNPNSSTTLESVKRVLEKEEIVKSDKRLRKRAIAIVSRDLNCPVSDEKLKKMVETEFQALKEQRASQKRKMGTAYRRLLNGDE